MTRHRLSLIVAIGAAFAAGSALVAGESMVTIPAGIYRPVTRAATDPETIDVASFKLDTLPVTNAEFLAFVTANPQWRRSRVSPLFADETYLRHWAGDLELGPLALPDAPVVNVTWFAARAYARAQNRRLPSLAEWELAAMAGYSRPRLDATNLTSTGISMPGWLR
jgi:sulfatase modifying factor 1